MLVLVKLLKVTLLHGCFPHFLNCTNGTKLCKASHMYYIITVFVMHETSIANMKHLEIDKVTYMSAMLLGDHLSEGLLIFW